MTKQPLFSLLMANYNNAKYIDEAINSVLMQTYQNWEIIIVDDCSTDNSKEIYKKYEHEKPIKIYYNEENKGVGYTYNKAGKVASGEILGILDPDDCLANHEALNIMVEKHESNPDAGVICSRHNVCNESMKILWISGIRNKDKNINYLTDREHNAEHFITIKANIYKQTSGFNPEYRNAIDQEFYYRMEEVTTILFIDEILYNYRLVNTGLTLQNYKGLYWHIKAITEACERRNINPEIVVDKLFKQVIATHEKKYNDVINSKYYRLGYKLLSPIQKTVSKFKSLFKQKN